MTREEFDSWAESPATQWVMRACRQAAESHKQSWMALSWEGADTDPLKLRELRARYDAYADIVECSYEEWCGLLGKEPEPQTKEES